MILTVGNWVWNYGGIILTGGNWVWSNGGMILTVENWVWNYTDRVKLGMEQWWNDTDSGKLGMEHWWNDTEGNKRTWREMCPITSLFTTNPTQPDAGSNPGLHSDSLVTNCLSHDTVYKTVNLNVIRTYVTWDYLQCTNREQKSLNVVQNNFRI